MVVGGVFLKNRESCRSLQSTRKMHEANQEWQKGSEQDFYWDFETVSFY